MPETAAKWHIAHLARDKIARESAKGSPNLRMMVGCCNTIDTLLFDKAGGEEARAVSVDDGLVLKSNTQPTALYCTNPDDSDDSEDDWDEDDSDDEPWQGSDLGLSPLYPDDEELPSYSLFHHHKVTISEKELPYGLEDTDDETSDCDEPVFSDASDDESTSTECSDSEKSDDKPTKHGVAANF